MVIPPFGAAVVPYEIWMFTIDNFYEAQNPYAVRRPTPLERSRVPGHCVMLPDDTLVTPRLGPDQRFDGHTQKVYHMALQAIYQMDGSPTNFYIQEYGQGLIYYVNLKGEKVGVYSHGHTKYDLVEEDQTSLLGDVWKVLRTRPAPNGGRTIPCIGISSKQYVFVLQGQKDSETSS